MRFVPDASVVSAPLWRGRSRRWRHWGLVEPGVAKGCVAVYFRFRNRSRLRPCDPQSVTWVHYAGTESRGERTIAAALVRILGGDSWVEWAGSPLALSARNTVWQSCRCEFRPILLATRELKDGLEGKTSSREINFPACGEFPNPEGKENSRP